jgi:hypothetical protein
MARGRNAANLITRITLSTFSFHPESAYRADFENTLNAPFSNILAVWAEALRGFLYRRFAEVHNYRLSLPNYIRGNEENNYGR